MYGYEGTAATPLDDVLEHGGTRFTSATEADAFVRRAFVPEDVPPDRVVVVALALLSHDGLVHSHARQVFEAVLRSPALDEGQRIDLCRRILRRGEPDKDIRPGRLRPVRERALGEEVVIFDVPGAGRCFMTRRDSALCRDKTIVDAVKRYAAPALLRLGGSSANEVVRQALGVKMAMGYGRGHVMGALDVIAEHSGEMDANLVRRALAQWRRAPIGAVKLRAYELSVQMYGTAAARPALDDGDRKVRAWAEGVLAGQTSEGCR